MNVPSVIGSTVALISLGFGSVVFGDDAVLSAITTTRSFTNASPIVILDDAPAAPYPSIIEVEGMSGIVQKVAVSLVGLTHSFPDDLDVLLMAPGGGRTVLLSDSGGFFPLHDIVLTFGPVGMAAPNTLPIETSTYRPANWGLVTDTFDPPAPDPPYPVSLTNLYGSTPNGAWQLYVVDDTSGNIGSINGGWRLTITSEEIVPALSIEREGQTIQVSWPNLDEGYVLKRNSPIDRPGGWTTVTNEVSLIDGTNRVLLSIDSLAQFYRLEK
jgi:subtilisin-like proprotein convertase family protein